MSFATQISEDPHRLLTEFAQCRANTEAICARLEIEDHVVQPAAFVSPPKWHLAHTTWFFDCFLLGSGIGETLGPGLRRNDGSAGHAGWCRMTCGPRMARVL